MENRRRYPKALISEAKKLGLDETHLDKYYAKGMLAWGEYKPIGVTAPQLALAVVEEFVAAEKNRKFTIREEALAPEVVNFNKEIKVSSFVSKKKAEEVSHVYTNEVIAEWIDEARPKYQKRYGDKAESKLMAAAKLFEDSLIPNLVTESWSPPNEPKHPNKIGTKRHSWDMANWHEKMRKEAEIAGNKDALQHHTERLAHYKKNIMTPGWAIEK